MNRTPLDVLIDTNTLFDKKFKMQLEAATQAQRVCVHIPALVLVEHERHLAQREYVRSLQGTPAQLGQSVRFFRRWVAQLITDVGAGRPLSEVIMAFDADQAQWVSIAWGNWLLTQPTDYAQQTFKASEAATLLAERYKRRRKGKQTALSDVDWLIHKADWSIAAVARHTGWPIITDDNDPPFQQPGVTRLSVAQFATQYLQDAEEYL